MNGFWVLIAAGLLGAGARFAMSTSPRKWTRASVTDTLVGGIAAPIVFYVFLALPWTGPSLAKLDTVTEQAVTVAVIGYLASHAVVNVVRQRLRDWLEAAVDRGSKPPKDRGMC